MRLIATSCMTSFRLARRSPFAFLALLVLFILLWVALRVAAARLGVPYPPIGIHTAGSTAKHSFELAHAALGLVHGLIWAVLAAPVALAAHRSVILPTLHESVRLPFDRRATRFLFWAAAIAFADGSASFLQSLAEATLGAFGGLIDLCVNVIAIVLYQPPLFLTLAGFPNWAVSDSLALPPIRGVGGQHGGCDQPDGE